MCSWESYSSGLWFLQLQTKELGLNTSLDPISPASIHLCTSFIHSSIHYLLTPWRIYCETIEVEASGFLACLGSFQSPIFFISVSFILFLQVFGLPELYKLHISRNLDSLTTSKHFLGTSSTIRHCPRQFLWLPHHGFPTWYKFSWSKPKFWGDHMREHVQRHWASTRSCPQKQLSPPLGGKGRSEKFGQEAQS